MNKKRTYTYFMIIGNFQTKEIIQLLDIEPIEKNDIGDNGKYKDSLDFASVKLAISYKNTLIIEEQVQEIISILKPKIAILREIFNNHEVDFIIQSVVYLSEDTMPAISYNQEIIEFCHLTNSTIDCDLYDIRE